MADLEVGDLAGLRHREAALLPAHLLLASRADNADTLVDQLESGRLNSPDAISRWQRAEELRRDPGQVGIIVSLAIALVASIVAAGIGLVAKHGQRPATPAHRHCRPPSMGTTQRMLRTMVVMEAVRRSGCRGRPRSYRGPSRVDAAPFAHRERRRVCRNPRSHARDPRWINLRSWWP
ncbi:MAG: hypothetical protein R2710_08375 [Acidimicrobiales bacterium]